MYSVKNSKQSRLSFAIKSFSYKLIKTRININKKTSIYDAKA
jgi:hypothetical protein